MSETAFYTIGESNDRMVKWDIALNRLGFSKTYDKKVNSAAISGSTLVIGTESGGIESFNNWDLFGIIDIFLKIFNQYFAEF